MMTMGGPGFTPKREPGRISEEMYYELIDMMRGFNKRLEMIEEKLGLRKQPDPPCTFCNVLGAHQPWCEKNANRTSGT